MTTPMLALGAAVASAATFGLSTSLQHLVSSRIAETRPHHLLAALLHSRTWVSGMTLGVTAFVFHAVALTVGSIVLVQPVIVTGVVFAVLIRSALDRRWPAPAEVAWAGLAWGGLAVFIIGAGSPSAAESPPTHAAPAVAVLLVLATVGALLSRRRPASSTGKGLWLGAVSGVLFGLVAVLLKLTIEAGTAGLVPVLTTWTPWVMLVCGFCAVLVNQRAYQTTRLSVSMPLLNIVNVLVALGLAAVVFGETPRLGAVPLLAEAAGLTAMTLGVIGLARLVDRDHLVQPASTEVSPTPGLEPLPPAPVRELEGSLR